MNHKMLFPALPNMYARRKVSEKRIAHTCDNRDSMGFRSHQTCWLLMTTSNYASIKLMGGLKFDLLALCVTSAWCVSCIGQFSRKVAYLRNILIFWLFNSHTSKGGHSPPVSIYMSWAEICRRLEFLRFLWNLLLSHLHSWLGCLSWLGSWVWLRCLVAWLWGHRLTNHLFSRNKADFTGFWSSREGTKSIRCFWHSERLINVKVMKERKNSSGWMLISILKLSTG